MNTCVIGIDLSKDTFDCVGLDQDLNICFTHHQYQNSPNGIAEFLIHLDDLSTSTSIWVCMEDTGVYGYLLMSSLSQAGMDYSVLNPLQVKYSMGLTRGKTDRIDAWRLAKYGVIHYKTLSAHTLMDEAVKRLQVLMSVRMRLIKTSTSIQNGIHALEEHAKTMDVGDILDGQKNILEAVQHQIKHTEKQMLELVKSRQELKENYSKIISVIGVGPITALMCLIHTENFTKFENGRKFNCYCGLAPFAYQSGSSVKGKTKTSPMRSRPMKAILMKAATTAMIHDPQLRAYYKRKIKEGKPKLCVLNAVANKLVLRIFAVQKRDEPFVKLTA